MTPTLTGRLQTRAFILATVGLVWTLIVSPFLSRPEGAGLGDVFETTLSVLLAVGVVGLGWEFIYHFAMQFRWEKDWPTMLGLLTGVNEFVLLWVLIESDGIPWISESIAPAFGAYFVHFATTWVVVWLFLNGPMRLLFVRWRFRGGELL
jgi:hypothetical protein